MQRILNDPDYIVDEMLSGFLKAHSDIVAPTGNPRVVKAKKIRKDKVGVVTGGGSGHKPAFIGYVGENLCDAAAVGEICSSPTAAAFLDVFEMVSYVDQKPVSCISSIKFVEQAKMCYVNGNHGICFGRQVRDPGLGLVHKAPAVI